MGPQQQALRRGVDIVVATPGRLLDHFQHQYAALKSLEVLVLDEADRMLDIGFLPDIRRVLKHVPAQRQTLMFSATLPSEIVTLSKEILRNPVSIEVGRTSTEPAGGITHAMYPVPANLKSALLAELLKRGEIKSVIVFTRTKHPRQPRGATTWRKNGIEAGRIHGNRSQGQRTDALAALKSGRIPVLVATDIAARGIDVEALSHVVNFDVPNSPEDYVHRAGRTARADMKGDAFLFVSPDEEQDAARIERAIGKRIPRVVVPGFDYKSKAEALEIPLGQRLAAMRAQRSAGHARRNAGSASPRPSGGHPPSHRPLGDRTGGRRARGRVTAAEGDRRARAAERVPRPDRAALVRAARSGGAEQLLQGVQVDRLGQVVIEARLPGPAPVLVLAPAGQRDQDHAIASAARGSGAPPRSRSAAAARCPGAPRPAGSAAATSTASRPSWAVRTSLPAIRSSMARLSAASRLSSTTRMRRLEPARELLARRAGARLRGPSAGGDRQAHDELAALARAVALRLDGAAVHLDQPLHQRQADAQPALRALQRPVHLGEHVEDAGQHLGRDADAGVPDPDHRLLAVPLDGEPDAPAALGVLGGVVQQVRQDLGQPGQVGVQRGPAPAAARPSARGPAPR